MFENYDHCHHQKTMRTNIYTKSKKNCETFYIKKFRNFSKSKTISITFLYTKIQTLFKKLDNSRYVFKYKKPYTWRYGIFMKFLKLAFIFKKHDTLRYVTFLYTKSKTLRKKQDNLLYVFIYKTPALLRYCLYEIPDHNLRTIASPPPI